MSVLQMKSFPEVRFEFIQPCFIYWNDMAIFLLFFIFLPPLSSAHPSRPATPHSSAGASSPPPSVRPDVARESYVAVCGAKVFLLSMLTALDTCGVLSLHTLRLFFSCHPFCFFSWGECVRGGEGERFPPEGQEERTELSLPIRAPSI